ncbi:pyridoxamine 5'-phosphate oxidase family protein [Modestobacter sp. NPDC049651]|uniref:pyridoxamine 5'-phosphate oxidase family protein n=1 Tax=unclassified Modestobacter TaxID=2643866 RepID=UPI00340AAED2
MPRTPPERRIEVLDEAECRRLLRTAPIGRIAYTEAALPAIQPVHFVVHGDEVLIPTRLTSSVALAVAGRGAVVAFSADDVDPVTRTGWDVTAVGAARLITDPAELRALDRLGARRCAPGDPCYVAVGLTVLRGRRVLPALSAAAG